MSSNRSLLLWAAILALLVDLGPQVAAQLNPVRVARVAGDRGSEAAALSGNFAFLACGFEEFWICNVSNPTNPVVVGPRTVVSVYDIAVSGNYAYQASGNGVRVVDVSNPTNPVNVAAFSDDTSAEVVVISGNYAYVGTRGLGYRIYNVANPTNPVCIKSLGDFAFGEVDVAVADNYAYFVNGDYSGLSVYDVSDPTNAVHVGSKFAQDTIRVLVSGNYAYCGTGSNGVFIYDISDRTHPVAKGHLDFNLGTGQMALYGNYLFPVYGDVGIFDVSDPSRSRFVTSLDCDGDDFYVNVAISGNYAYVSGAFCALSVYWLGILTPPQLSIRSTSTNTLALSWPAPTGPFRVQQNSTLNSANWVTLTNQPVVVASRNQAVLTAPSGDAFYRLISQ